MQPSLPLARRLLPRQLLLQRRLRPLLGRLLHPLLGVTTRTRSFHWRGMRHRQSCSFWRWVGSFCCVQPVQFGTCIDVVCAVLRAEGASPELGRLVQLVCMQDFQDVNVQTGYIACPKSGA